MQARERLLSEAVDAGEGEAPPEPEEVNDWGEVCSRQRSVGFYRG